MIRSQLKDYHLLFSSRAVSVGNPREFRLCRKAVTNMLLSTKGGIFAVPSLQYVVWFVNFATEPIGSHPSSL
jgi:hypothetical protein